MSNIAKQLGLNIKKFRRARGLSQEKLSEMIGIQPRQMSKLETGVHYPPEKTLEAICISLDVEPMELYDFSSSEIGCDMLLNGTYNFSNYRVLKNDNVYHLLNKEDKTREKFLEYNDSYVEQRFIDMAVKNKRTITVEYFEANKYANTIIYYPNGEYKIYDANKNTKLNQILQQIVDISNDKNKLEFIELALRALSDPEVIPALELVLKGLNLARNTKT